jgi:glutamate dehydrogenase
LLRARGDQLHVQDFELESRQNLDIDISSDGERIVDTVQAVWRLATENDAFNKLVLASTLNWREAGVLRAYCRWLLQTGIPFSQSYVESVLSRMPLPLIG